MNDPTGPPLPPVPPHRPGEQSSEDASALPPSSSTSASRDWRRVHPMTLIFEFLAAARQVLFGLLAIRLGVLSTGEFSQWLEYAAIGIPLIGAVVRWLTTRYLVDEEVVRLEQGLIRRRRDVMARDKVQNVSASATALGRVLGMSQLQVSDASGGDLTIKFIGRGETDRLTDELRIAPQPPASPSPAAQGSAPATPVPIGTASPHSVERGGSAPIGPPSTAPVPPTVPVAELWPNVEADPPLIAPSFGTIVAARLGMTMTTLASSLPLALIGIAIGVGIARRANIDVSVPDIGQGVQVLRAGGLSVGFTALALLSIVGGAVGSVIALGRFQLWDDGEEFRIRSGLLSEQRLSARRARIQSVRIEQSVGLRLLSLERVRFVTADLELLGGEVTTFLSPGQPAGTWREVAQRALGPISLGVDDLQQVSPLSQRRTFIRHTVGGTLLTLPSAVLWWPAAVVFLTLWVAGAAWFAVRRYQRLGFAFDDTHLMVRSGVLDEELLFVDLDKVQVIRTSATFFQRRLHLANLVIISAGMGGRGTAVIPDLPNTDAERLADGFARRAAAVPLAATL